MDYQLARQLSQQLKISIDQKYLPRNHWQVIESWIETNRKT